MTDSSTYLADFIRGIDASRSATAQDAVLVQNVMTPLIPISAAALLGIAALLPPPTGLMTDGLS